MALFEGYERRIEKINAVLKEYGINSVEECKEICLAKGVDCDKIVRAGQLSTSITPRVVRRSLGITGRDIKLNVINGSMV